MEEKTEEPKVSKIKETNIDGERIFLKNDFLGWHVVHPYKIDGKWNLKNLIAGGSWIRLILVVGLCALLVGATLEVLHIVNIANECLNSNHAYLNISNLG